MDDDTYLADAEETLGPTDTQLSRVVTLGLLQVDQEDAVADLERQLKDAKEALRRTCEADLPEALSQAGITHIGLRGGREVDLEREVYANITEENLPAAIDWLDENGHGDIVKNDVAVSFPRGKEEDALELLEHIKSTYRKLKPKNKRYVHSSTLKAFAKEQLSKNVELPNAITVHTVTRSVITRPKQPNTDDSPL